MKKLSFFLMAMLVSLTSIAAEVTGTLTFDDKAKRTVFSTSQQVWVENGVTMTNDKSASTSNVADYAKPVRLYASSKVTVSCDGVIKSIVFDCNSASYATSLKGSITSGGTVTVSSDKVTVVPTAEANEFVIAKLSAQVRMDAITVTYAAEEENPDATIYTITATSADETMGTVAGAGEYAEGKTVTLTANANPGYEFVKWSNESTENPLIFEATENVTLTASFVAQTPITIAEANKLGDSKTAVLNEFTVTYVYKSYIHIQDASGYGMIFQSNFGLKVGDVVSGLTCSKSTYNGLPQFIPTCKLADLTIEAGEAPAVVELTTAPTGNYHQVVKLMNLQMTGSFVTDSYSTIDATCPDGTKIAIYNAKNNLAYTFVADKTYNITGDVCQYSGKIQVSVYAIEEYVAPEPCTLATPVNWDAPIAAEANTDQWYAVNVKSAIAAGKDLALTVTNPGTEAVEVSIEAYADCPATELIVKSTKTFNAGETKTTTVKYDEYLADQVEVVYLHVVTSGDLTIGTEAIEPCSKATAINWNDPIAAAANLDAWYAVNVESAIAAGKDLALTVSNPSTEAVEVTVEAYANCPATEKIAGATSTINAGATKTTTVKYDEYLADQVKVVYMHVTTKGGEIKVEAETVKFNVTATAENGTVEGAGIYEQGAEATLTATPAEGYEFVNWTVDGAEVSTENPYKFTVTADVALVANFKKAAPAKLYLTPNANWKKDNARFAAYFFDNGETWVSMTKVAGETGLYEVTIPTNKKYPKVIFCRMNPNASANNWNNKWNQTADLVIPTDGKNHYTVKENTWDKGGGTWSIWPVPTVKTYVDITITVTANAPASIKWANAGDKLADATEYVAMTAGENNTYTYTLAQVEEAKGVDYTIKVGDIVSTTKNTSKNVTVDFKNLLPQVAIEGIDGKWDSSNKMTVSDDYLTASITLPLAAKDHAWKLTIDAAWLGGSKFVITRTNNSVVVKEDAGGDGKLTADIAGDYVFTWTYASQTLTVTYPALPVKYNVTVTAENGTVTGAGEYEEGKTATLTATANEGYEFVNWTVGEEVVSTENPYSFVVTADVALVANFKAVEPEIEWIPMDLEITNLTTEVMEVEGAKYLLLQGRDDMLDSDVMLFLNNYADVDDDYEVNAESSYMTFGGLELTVLEGVMTQTSETEKGTIYTGTVRASVEEEGETMYVEFALTMYAAPATVIELTDAIVAINEELGTLTFNVATGEGEGYYAELAGYTGPGVHEGPQICLFETPEVVAFANYVETSVADGIITLKGLFTSAMGPKFDVTISGKLPVEEPVEKPEPTYTENTLNPYAFGLTSKLSADKSTLIVNYRLNNSKATKADVIVYNGQDTVIIVGGTTNIGKNTVEISTEGFPGGVELTWAVIVNGTSVAAPTREEKIYSFYHPSGLDIDINPENETFGLLLVNEGMQSVASTTSGYVSSGFGAGIFAFTPSFDLIPNGELPGYNGGITFTTGRADNSAKTAYAPRRIRVSEDGRIFVTSLNTDGNYLWEVNPANMNEWTPVFKAASTSDQAELLDAEGNFIAAPNAGFDVKGSGENLQLAMYSATISGIDAFVMGGFRLHEYNLGTATEWATAPSKAIVEGKYAINYTGTQVEYDNEGGLWIASYRGSATDANPGLVHINAQGVEDAKLVWNNVRQAGIRFNKDFTKLVVAGNNGAAKKATIYTISKDANGAPVLTQEAVVDMAVVGNNLNDFAWDYAGNLYACGNSAEKLAAWAMPYSGEVETPAASKYAFQLEGKTEVEYEVYEDEITNLVIDYDNMLLIGGPSANLEVDVYLGLGDYDRNTDNFALLPESSVAIRGIDATFVEGWASVDGIAQTANAVVRCVWNEMNIELHLAMSAATIEPTVVVVENAAIEIEKVLLFGDMYDYALKMTGTWTDAEGLNYPVLVEVPVYYPEATEPYEIYSTVTVGGWDDDENWLGFGEGYLTITEEGNKITAAGIVENAWAGIAIDITISGNINNPGLALDNATVVIKSIKKIQNGQLIIEKDGVQYNAQGAIVK